MIKFAKLGEICLVRRGTTITKEQTKKGNIPVIAGGREAAYFHNRHNRSDTSICKVNCRFLFRQCSLCASSFLFQNPTTVY